MGWLLRPLGKFVATLTSAFRYVADHDWRRS